MESNTHILVVEDVLSNYILIEATCSSLNAKIIWAKDGNEAVEKFKSDPLIKLILMDLQLPEMDGNEATREIRKLNNSVPIIAVTAFAVNSEKVKSIAAGCTEYYAKPIKPRDFKEVIRKYLL